MAGITRIGPLSRATNWLSNAVDAAEEATRAGKNYMEHKKAYNKLPAPMKTPKRTEEILQMKDRVRQERGQYFGALLQGRQYDKSGKQIKAKNKKK